MIFASYSGSRNSGRRSRTPSTGTLSAKAVDFQINQTGKDIYKQWRDAYVRHDPEKAKQLLDELGLKDTDGDGMRELPNGKKLALRLEYSADESAEHSAKGNQLVADLAKVGLKMTRTPIPPQSFDDQWMSGKLMAHTNWEVGDGHPLIYPGWIVPTQYPQLMVIKSDLMNVPRRENLALGGFVNPWIHPTPAAYDPECYYWQDPSKHT